MNRHDPLISLISWGGVDFVVEVADVLIWPYNLSPFHHQGRRLGTNPDFFNHHDHHDLQLQAFFRVVKLYCPKISVIQHVLCQPVNLTSPLLRYTYPRNSRPYFCGFINYWFPLIRPATKPLFPGGFPVNVRGVEVDEAKG